MDQYTNMDQKTNKTIIILLFQNYVLHFMAVPKILKVFYFFLSELTTNSFSYLSSNNVDFTK